MYIHAHTHTHTHKCINNILLRNLNRGLKAPHLKDYITKIFQDVLISDQFWNSISDISMLCVKFRRTIWQPKYLKAFSCHVILGLHSLSYETVIIRYRDISKPRDVGLMSNERYKAFSQHHLLPRRLHIWKGCNYKNTRSLLWNFARVYDERCPWEKPWWFQVTHQTSQWSNLSRWLFWHGNDLLTITGIHASSG